MSLLRTSGANRQQHASYDRSIFICQKFRTLRSPNSLCGSRQARCFYEEGLDTFNWLPGVLIAQEAGAEVLKSHGIPWTWGCDSLNLQLGLKNKRLRDLGINIGKTRPGKFKLISNPAILKLIKAFGSVFSDRGIPDLIAYAIRFVVDPRV